MSAIRFDSIRTQVISVTPYAGAVALKLLSADMPTNIRMHSYAGNLFAALVGSTVFYVGPKFVVGYTGRFFLLGVLYRNIVNNTARHTPRPDANAVETVVVDVGAIVSNWIFSSSDTPNYLFTATYLLAMDDIALVVTGEPIRLFSLANSKKSTSECRQKLLADMMDENSAQQLEKPGDAPPGYKYVL
ncbi:uncharacterized protein A1O5_07437 [Cladophialophora psammophila CBS 110553]|uniref:Uncharacterized protein n=1 Tax=Cladophialophora psammophila CBS 110553 TaxID=1182543 RepID=W9WXN9_9EURO|nr:uncharacterized protein A1O5_07437 [Cladophialophora psammophila CBS 110553]EXJ69401.1 hypothetical protein A1O5_07437 [Cladophialophora psammophila CBS 110553]